MRIVPEIETLGEIVASNCSPGGRAIERRTVPIVRLRVEDWPNGDAQCIALTSDLQCFDRHDVPPFERRLLSYVVAEELERLSDENVLPPCDNVGIVLGGDLYAIASLDKRGGSGDVQGIWRSFADRFRWVVGVAGNHDLFDGVDKFGRLSRISNIFPLHGDCAELDGLNVAGISGIPGRKKRIWRYDEQELIEFIQFLLSEPQHILLLHQGPLGSGPGQRGFELINHAIDQADCPPDVIAFGHCYWKDMLTDYSPQTQLLSLECRVIVLEPAN